MQRNLRSGMHFMEREIRMACCDPTGKANAGIITANKNSNFLDGNGYILRFTEDIQGGTVGSAPDGDTLDPNEDIAYTLRDYDSDGDTDLLRNGAVAPGNTDALIAENIDAVDFVYLDKNDTPLDDDGNGNVTAQDSLRLITSIQITMVARTGLEDPKYIDTTTYKNQQGAVIYAAAGDHFRRRLITTNIKCRNPER